MDEDPEKNAFSIAAWMPDRALVAAIEKCANKPAMFIQASAIGIYGTSETEEKNEASSIGE